MNGQRDTKSSLTNVMTYILFWLYHNSYFEIDCVCTFELCSQTSCAKPYSRIDKIRIWFKGNMASNSAVLISCSFDARFIFEYGIYSESEAAVFWKRRNLLTRGIKGWYTNSQTTLTSLTEVPLEGTVLTVGLLASTPCHWERFECIVLSTAW